MASCPICNHVNPAGTARCEKCDSWLAQAADVGLKPQVRPETASANTTGSASPLTPQFADELLAILQAGRKIEAIALFRERTGLGLRESKAAVEALEAGRPLPNSEAAAGVDEGKVVALLRENQFISAIKEYRTATGLGLKEAKDAVEGIARKHGIVPKQQGCLGALLLLSTAIPLTMWCVAQFAAAGR
ncbi:MAG: ribosomal protein L7/L12 [Planctomycetia bacterium]|nr:ribosomal protein L7/L12 [Planctomycetia bacterium]